MSLYSTDHIGGSKTYAYTPSASDTPIKSSPGRLCKIVVTATGTTNTLIYDNPSTGTGTVIGVIKSTAAIGDVIEFLFPALLGITVKGATTNASFTASYD